MEKTPRFLSSCSLLIALAVEVGCSETPPAAPIEPTTTTAQAPTKPVRGKRAPKDVTSQQNNSTGLTQ